MERARTALRASRIETNHLRALAAAARDRGGPNGPPPRTVRSPTVLYTVARALWLHVTIIPMRVWSQHKREISTNRLEWLRDATSITLLMHSHRLRLSAAGSFYVLVCVRASCNRCALSLPQSAHRSHEDATAACRQRRMTEECTCVSQGQGPLIGDWAPKSRKRRRHRRRFWPAQAHLRPPAGLAAGLEAVAAGRGRPAWAWAVSRAAELPSRPEPAAASSEARRARRRGSQAMHRRRRPPAAAAAVAGLGVGEASQMLEQQGCLMLFRGWHPADGRPRRWR